MLKFALLALTAICLLSGCSVDTEKCLQKEGFKNCEDLKDASKKAVGNDEAYRFLSIAKKCHCKDQ